MTGPTPAEIARLFHEAYETLAPSFGYETRKESAVPWEQVPEQNRALMTAVAAAVLSELRGQEEPVDIAMARLDVIDALGTAAFENLQRWMVWSRGQYPDESPGDVIAAEVDGTIVLDDGVTTWNPLRALEFMVFERSKLLDKLRSSYAYREAMEGLPKGTLTTKVEPLEPGRHDHTKPTSISPADA